MTRCTFLHHYLDYIHSQIMMEKCAPRHGCFLNSFCDIYEYPLCCVSGFQIAVPFFVVRWWGSNPWQELIGVSFFHYEVEEFQPLAGPCYIIFQNSLALNVCMCPGPYVWHTWTSLSLSTLIFMISQRCLGGEPKDACPKRSDQATP